MNKPSVQSLESVTDNTPVSQPEREYTREPESQTERESEAEKEPQPPPQPTSLYSEDSEPPLPSRPASRWLGVLLALACLFGVIIWLDEVEDTIDVQQKQDVINTPVVSVEYVQVKPETVTVSAFAEVRPRWSAQLKAAANGRVISVADQALAGSHVQQGTELIRLEDTAYMADVTQAELNLAEAKSQLLRAESKTAVAKRQYGPGGDSNARELALHLPELKVAKAAVKAAQARLQAARVQLSNTRITAPFSGFITERLVSLGQSISIGEPLIQLVDDNTLELTVELSQQDWALVQQPIAGQIAELFDRNNQSLGQALIRRGGGFLDQQSRQHRIFLEVQNADKSPILSGDFVRVALPGISVPDALNVPASALTQEGELWYLDQQDRLQRLQPEILFRKQQRLIIRAPLSQQRPQSPQGPQGSKSEKNWRIALTPLATFLPGQQVQAQASVHSYEQAFSQEQDYFQKKSYKQEQEQ